MQQFHHHQLLATQRPCTIESVQGAAQCHGMLLQMFSE
jgi:hypothetical protein